MAAEYNIVLGSLLSYVGMLRYEPCAICLSSSGDFYLFRILVLGQGA